MWNMCFVIPKGNFFSFLVADNIVFWNFQKTEITIRNKFLLKYPVKHENFHQFLKQKLVKPNNSTETSGLPIRNFQCEAPKIFDQLVAVPVAYRLRAYTLRFPLYVTIFAEFSKSLLFTLTYNRTVTIFARLKPL